MIASSENGLTRSGPPLDQRVAAVLEGRQATHRGRDRGADPIGLLLDHDPRIKLRLPRRRDDQLREAVHPPRLPVLDPPGRVELLRLAGEADREATRIKGTNRTGGGAAGDQALPARRDAAGQRRHRAEPRDYHSPMSVRAHQPPIPVCRV
jgi:hypothetical protein